MNGIACHFCRATVAIFRGKLGKNVNKCFILARVESSARMPGLIDTMLHITFAKGSEARQKDEVMIDHH